MSRFYAVAKSATYPDGKKMFTTAEEAQADLKELKGIKEQKIAEIKHAASAAKIAPVEINGITYHGGDTSAQRARDKREMTIFAAQAQGAGSGPHQTDFRDINNNKITMDTDDLYLIAFKISQAFENAFQRELDLIEEVNKIDITQENFVIDDVQAAIENINW